MKRAPFTLALLLLPTLARAQGYSSPPSGQNLITAAGITYPSTVSRTANGNGSSMTGPCSLYWPAVEGIPTPCSPYTSIPPVMTGTINLYIIWYSLTSNPWDSIRQNEFRAAVQAMNSSPWFTIFEQYTNSCGQYATGITIAGECTDPENEGTTFTCDPQSSLTPVGNNIGSFGCGLPVDPGQGFYFVIPSAPITLTGGCGAASQDCYNGDYAASFGNPPYGHSVNCGVTQYPTSAQFYQYGNGAFYLTLNGDGYMTRVIGAFEYELAHQIVNPTDIGWICAPPQSGGFQQITDMCAPTSDQTLAGWTYSTATGGPSAGQPASVGTLYSGTHYDFPLIPLWNLAGSCSTQLLPVATQNTPCRTDADCPQTSQSFTVCRNFLCGSSCVDGVLDGDESDVDCGGSCFPNIGTYTGFCTTGKMCRTAADCNSGVCTSGICG